MTSNAAQHNQPLPRLASSLAGLLDAYRRGTANCLSVVEICLARIDALDPLLCAWAFVDREGARAQARRLDEERHRGVALGMLHGVPMGIKDIIDVQHMPTTCGAQCRQDRNAKRDAEIVARLRKEGAIIMGKTVTTPYAWIDPPPTRNPWNPTHTPGGSSSGSAAAVAAGMCSAAIGTQTGGSILRPATFCGVCGFKPTYDAVSREGVLPLAPSLDHVGPIARTVGDLTQVFMVIADRHRGHPPEPIDTIAQLRLGRLRGFFDDRLDPRAAAAHETALLRLASSGVVITDIEPTKSPLEAIAEFETMLNIHREIMAREAALVHRARFTAHPDDYPPRISELILEGLALDDQRLAERQTLRPVLAATFQTRMDQARVDTLVVPATTGPAPDTSTTGDPAFNSPFSLLGFPAVSFPTALVDGLPVGLQLVGRPGHDLALLQKAALCHELFLGELALSDHRILSVRSPQEPGAAS